MKKNPLLFGLGNLASSLTAAAFSSYAIFFYVDHLKLPALLIGTGMSIYGIWNAINDPILGHISDRTQTRMGRRVPYILYGTVPFVVVFAMVWLPRKEWFGGSITALFAYFMIVIFLYDGLYTMLFLNWTSLFPEMYQEEGERNRVSAVRQIFGIVGNILGIAVPPLLYNKIGWAAMGLGFAIITLFSMVLGFKSFEEDPSYREAGALGLKDAIISTFKNYSFVMYVLAALFLQFTFVMLQGVLPFYTKYVLHVGDVETSIILGVIFISAAFVVFVWSYVTDRIGSRNSMILATIIYGICLAPFWFISSFMGAVIAAAFLGLGLAGLMVLLDILLSDTIDEDELKTGVRREGMYFGVNALLVRLGVSLQALIMGFVLDKTGYDANLTVQPQSAVTGFRMLITIIPMAALILALFFFYLYPLHGERLNNIKASLEKKRMKDKTA